MVSKRDVVVNSMCGLVVLAVVSAVVGCNTREVRLSECKPALQGGSAVEDSAEEFSKPDSYDEWSDYRTSLEYDQTEGSGGRREFVTPRDHMRTQFGPRTRTWLNEGESAVIDLGVNWWAPDSADGETVESELYVFVDFRPVEFDLIRVDADPAVQDFPTVEEATGIDELHRSESLSLPERTPKAYTLVLPPESLGPRGAHDVRIVSFRESTFDRGVAAHADRVHTWQTMTLNYGASTFVAGPKLERLETEMRRPSMDVLQPLSRAHTLLVPPGDSAEQFLRTDTGRTLPADGDRVRLKGWMEGIPRVDQVPFASVVLKDGRMVEGSRSLVTLPHRPRLQPSIDNWRRPDQPYAATFELEVPLDDHRRHDIQMVSFANPLCSQPGDARSSNTIRLQRNETE